LLLIVSVFVFGKAIGHESCEASLLCFLGKLLVTTVCCRFFPHKSKSIVILVTPLEGLHFYILPNWDDGSVVITD
jgi:hypothetical protein